MVLEPSPAVRPFLKWAGGKRQLLRELRRYVPRDFPAYHEPFLGSGALFFDLWRSNRLHGTACQLGDANADLVGVYRALADDTENVIAQLRLLASEHQDAGAPAYYRVRDEIFNPERRTRQRGPASSYPAHLAAMFIYLNRTGYNGLFRLNSQGDFNVPVGRYAAPRICDEPTLRAAAAVLRSPSVTLHHRTFTAVAAAAGPGDLVYFDPPVRAAQCHVAVYVVHRGEFFGKRPAGAAGSGRGARRAGLRGGGQQFDRGRGERTLPGARSAPGRSQDLPHPRAAGDQLEGRAPGNGRRIHHQ